MSDVSVPPVAAAAGQTAEPDGWDSKKTEGIYREVTRLTFDDGSKLRLTAEVEAGPRAFASEAGAYLERLRSVIQGNG